MYIYTPAKPSSLWREMMGFWGTVHTVSKQKFEIGQLRIKGYLFTSFEKSKDDQLVDRHEHFRALKLDETKPTLGTEFLQAIQISPLYVLCSH